MASIFSRIIAGEIPSYKVAEDENYYAFPGYQSADERAHAGRTEKGNRLHFRPRRSDIGRHDAVRQKSRR